jgi:hypothetical protein
MTQQNIILHISDLHFSAKCDEQAQANRKLLLDGLVKRLKGIEVDWRPTLVCITGDITDKGQATGYNDAADWLKELSKELAIDISRFLLVPGNHDCVRDQQVCPKLIPVNPEEADSLLCCNTPPYLQKRFEAFSSFCKTLGIPPYKLGDSDSYLVGCREINGIQFVACNTSWFSWEQNEQSNLWLGLEILHFLESNKQLVEAGADPAKKLSVALMHHGTDKYFHPAEIEDRGGNRPPALKYLWKRCHLALYGHSHETALDDPTLQIAHCWTVRAGATYAGANFPNNVNLIRFSHDRFELRSLECNPSDADAPWGRSTPVKPYPWSTVATQQHSDARIVAKISCETQFKVIRERAIKYAAEVIVNKSHQIKPRGTLPEQISLQVALKPESELDTAYFSPEHSHEKPKLTSMTIDEAVSRSRLTILFGELGAGKSTLLAKLAEKIGENVHGCLPLFIPALRLEIATSDGINKLIAQLDSFIAFELNAGEQWSFKQVLDNGIELLLLVDGLDEIDKKTATHLLRLLAKLPEVYSHVTVVLASRFSEMTGINFERWQVCQVLLVDAFQKEALFKNEALAQGATEAEAIVIASRVKLTLENNPTLNAVANTPLAVRLLYPSLTAQSLDLQERTLGDLLYELLLQRLGEWSECDVKTNPFEELEQVLPSPEFKAIIVGELALSNFEQGTLSRSAAIEIIKRNLPEDRRSHADLVAKQFLTFLEDAGIIIGKNSINFVYQPLAQISAGAYLAEKLRKNLSIAPLAIELWRVVAFSATLIRRTNKIDDARDWFGSCITKWMKERRGITPSCYVCDELRDYRLAEQLVELLPQLRRRPLWYLEEERAASTQAIASTLVLAGEKGFDWLYSEYLDPRMPPTNSGSALISSLCGTWALLAKPHLSASQKLQLRELVPPLLATSPSGTHGFLECLAYLVPEAFEQTQLLWIAAGQLDYPRYYFWVQELLRQAHQSGNHDVVNAILERKPSKEGALLWIELNREIKPPLSILRAFLSAKWSWQREEQRVAQAVTHCREHIGENHWCYFLRWCLTDQDSKVAASVALELFEGGERSFYLLGNALSSVLDDGGIGNKAEVAMRKLISHAKATDIKWASCLFANGDRTMGARAGNWRIFLEILNAGYEGGPDLLVDWIDSIGPFNLPRYPDIRLAFQTLLAGQNGQLYKKALRSTLNHYNPSVRHAAAMVLTVSCPNDEGLALITAVSFVGQSHRSDYWEWEKFLVTLNFGATVLEALKTVLNTLSSKARMFGLALLLKHEVKLPEHDLLELLCSGDWQTRQHIESELGLKSDFARSVLIRELDTHSIVECKHIAESLLKFHGENLSHAQRAKCFVATVDDQIGWRLSLTDLIDQLKNDIELFKEIALLRKNTAHKDFPKLIYHLMDIDGRLNISWEELIWDIFCSDHKLMSHREDDIGLELYWLGKKITEYGEDIGRAAALLLDDERIQKQRWTNHYHWLVVLADEFTGIDKGNLQKIVCVGHPTYQAATCSLLKRLGVIPAEFSARDRHNSLPKDLITQCTPLLTAEEFRIELFNAARESEWLKPDIEKLIASTLLEHEITQEFLDELAAKGNNGGLMAGVLAYCGNLTIKADYAISFIQYFEPPDRQNSSSIHRLKSTAMLSYFALTHLDEAAKNEYLSRLYQAINQDEQNSDHFIYELLRIEQTLTIEQIELLLPKVAQIEYDNWLNRKIVQQLSDKISNITEPAVLEKIKQICPSCFEKLDMASWSADDFYSGSPAILLLFVMMYWAVGGEPDEKSGRVFARAIKLMFHHKESFSNSVAPPQQYEIVASVNPLICLVPKATLRSALERLVDFPEPEVRMWVSFFACFLHSTGDNT